MKIQKRHIVLASLVLALGAAVYINWQLSAGVPEVNKTKELGKATYVNSNVTASDDEYTTEVYSSLSKEQQNYFSNAKLKRKRTTDEIINIALDALSNSESDEDAKETALAQLADTEKLLMNQDTIENTVIAKGFSDCVCSINDNSATVIVPKNEMSDNSALIIKDAVTQVCNIPFENINIVTV